MKSFPSAFNKNPRVSANGAVGDTIKSTIKNAIKTALIKGTSGSDKTKEDLGQRLDYTLYQDRYALHNARMTDIASNVEMRTSPRVPALVYSQANYDTSMLNRFGSIGFNGFNKNGDAKPMYENFFNIPSSILQHMNNYTLYFQNPAENILLKTAPRTTVGTPVTGKNLRSIVTPSLFNPYMGINVLGWCENVPLMYTTTDGLKEISVAGLNVTAPTVNDKSDCSVRTLVEESKKGHMGSAIYKYADFMYCKDIGVIPNNQMITLRKFAMPIPDNIFREGAFASEVGDIGRMVTFFNDENKMEDIIQYEYEDTFKSMESDIQQLESQEDSSQTGILGSLINAINPSYAKGVEEGYWGGQNQVYGWIAGKINNLGLGTIVAADGGYQNTSILSNYDEHRVYTPKGTVWDTHLYEGRLKFSHEFTLVFRYKMRSYDGINGKSAFLDLIGNIMQTTYRAGTFWGGQQKIVGAPGNSAGWAMTENLINKTYDKIGGIYKSLTNEMFDAGDIMGSIANIVGKARDGAQGAVQQYAGNVSSAIGAAISNISSAIKGMFRNRFGRPAFYAFNSLLEGNDVGFWHVTLGNPRNPILAIGNLILTKARVQHFGPLGIDDFPTEIRVTCSFKHGRGRDSTDIQKMYTMGMSSIYTPLNQGDIESKYIKKDGLKSTKSDDSNEKSNDNKEFDWSSVTPPSKVELTSNIPGAELQNPKLDLNFKIQNGEIVSLKSPRVRGEMESEPITRGNYSNISNGTPIGTFGTTETQRIVFSFANTAPH